MVNTGLDTKRTARAGGQMNFDPIPEAEYILRVKEIEPWKKSVKTIAVIVRDENGNVLKDEKGKNITENVENCEFYNCNVKFEVVGGEYDGRVIFHNLTTHPNMNWSIDNFLYAVGIDELAASQIQSVCVNRMCKGVVIIDSYKKTQQNKETGIDEEIEKKVNRIKSLKKLDTQNNNTNTNLTSVDLGI